MKPSRLATAAALLVPAVLALGASPAVAGAGPGGNNGTIKLSEVGGPEDQSNDPKLSCSFEVQWYGFDAGTTLMSHVAFDGQGADAKVGIKVTGTANWVVARAATEGNFEVTLTWQPGAVAGGGPGIAD